MDIRRLIKNKEEEFIMGYPTKIQLISRNKGNQWYVNFPNALAEAMNFKKGETVEWSVESIKSLRMVRKTVPKKNAIDSIQEA
jgi:antitoxin component of MazEF toxin-antitoxin module